MLPVVRLAIRCCFPLCAQDESGHTPAPGFQTHATTAEVFGSGWHVGLDYCVRFKMLEQIQKIAAPEEVLESVRASLALLKLEMKAFMDQCKTQNAKKLEWKFVIAQYAALCEKLQPTTDASWGEACARCELDMCTTNTLARLASLFFARSVRISTTTTCFDLNARPSLLVSLLVQRESKTVDMRLQSGRHRTSKNIESTMHRGCTSLDCIGQPVQTHATSHLRL